MAERVWRAWRRWRAAQRVRMGEPLQGPEWVHLGIADGCNYRCTWCRLHSPLLPPQGRHDLLPWRVFEELVEDLQALGTRLAEFGGVGEPLLHPQVLPMIRRVKEAGIQALLITNGAGLTREMCEELVALGVDRINVSLNVATDEAHERVHRAPHGDRARIVATLDTLRRLRDRRGDGRPSLSISSVVGRETCPELVALARQAAELRLTYFHFAPLGLNPASAQLVMTPAEEVEAREQVRAADRVLRAAGVGSNAATYLGRATGAYWTRDLLSHIPCHIGQLFSRVLATGEVYPCATNCWQSLGDLATVRFRDIWHSEAYRQFRREAQRLPRRKEPVPGCACWTCMQHFLIEDYYTRTTARVAA